MKINSTQVETQSNFNVESHEVGFDEESFGPLMTILSNLYSNKYEAVVREYSCNAWDSHVAAGRTDKPIQVTLPNAYQPTLLIQDFGLGLSKDEIINVYGRYGKSTKRDDNGQIGGFGIGAKAAFALGHQFVVTGVKDGHKTVVLFALNAQNIGEMKIVSESETKEPNGVLVSLGVEDTEQMCQEAEKFFSKWDRGTVLVNGKFPESMFEGSTTITESLIGVDRTYHGNPNVYVRVGQVSYLLSRNILGKVRDSFDKNAQHDEFAAMSRLLNSSGMRDFYLKSAIGEVEIAPNREALVDSSWTISNLASLFAQVFGEVEKFVHEKIEKAPTAFEAVKMMIELREAYDPIWKDKVYWNGLKLEDVVRIELPTLYSGTYKSRPCTDKYDFCNLNVSAIDSVLLLTGVRPEDEGSIRRAFRKVYDNSEYERIILGPEDVTNVSFGWWNYDCAHKMTVPEFKAWVKELRATAPTIKSEVSYTTNQGYSLYSPKTPLSQIIAEGKDLIVLEYGERWPFHNKMAQEVADKYTVLSLGPTHKLESLVKHLEKAGSTLKIIPQEIWEKEIEDHIKNNFVLTEDEKKAVSARIWLSNCRSDIDTWMRVNNTLSKYGEIGNEKFNEIMDIISNARENADLITKDRYVEINEHIGTQHVTFYEFADDVSSIASLFPIFVTWNYYLPKETHEDFLWYLNNRPADA